jgi:phosphohistidine phosphatase
MTATRTGRSLVALPSSWPPGLYAQGVIWFLRHGDAEDGDDDFARELTEKGERQSRDAGRALAELGVELDACITSPLVRAKQTAELACQALGLEPEEANELSGGDFDPHGLTAGRGNVLLVGHEPDFSRAVGDLTGARVEMKKGGIAAVEGANLVALLRSAHIKRIAG